MNTKLIEAYKARGAEIVRDPGFPSVFSEVTLNLGNTNSEIREGCLDVLWALVESGALSDSTMIETGDRMREHLVRGLGERDTDSVFLRTFSALILGLIVSEDEIRRRKRADGREPLLSAEQFHGWYEGAKQYVLGERDVRGYVGGKGWAHSIAHGADLLRDFAYHRFTAAADHTDILRILSARLTGNTEEMFLYNEDHRLARVAVTILLRGELSPAGYGQWLDDLPARFGGRPWIEFAAGDRGKAVAWSNTLAFLRALYFVLHIGMKNLKDTEFYGKTPGWNEEVKELVLKALIKMDGGLNYRGR